MNNRCLVLAAVLALACSDGGGSTAGEGGSGGAAGSGTSASGAAGQAAAGQSSAAASGGQGQAGGSAGLGTMGGGPAGGSADAPGGSSGQPSGGGTAGKGETASGGAGAGMVGGGMGGSGDAAGSGGTAGASPVSLPSGVKGLFPVPGATGSCADPALRLSFASTPKLGTSGKLRIFDAASASTVVTVDFAISMVTKDIGGHTFNLPRQIYVEGNDVVIPLASKALGYGKQYYVTLEAGAIMATGGAFSISDTKAWRFTTLASAASGSSLSVALDGSGQFCSWQGALDAVPAKNTTPVTISIKNGNYYGVVYFSGKQAITLHGQDRKKTVFSGINNNTLNPSTVGRALVGADGAKGLVVEDLTIRNLTPQGGSQAEALRLQNCDQCVVRRADILSLQDTLLWSGRLYAEDCYIAGNVDFIWGEGAAYFKRCEIKTVGRNGYIVQSRNGTGYGYVFVDSKITSDAGITGSTLARVDVSVYPNSHVAYVNCTLGNQISKAGWTITGGSAPSTLRFWEYQSKNESGGLIDVSGRVGGVQMTAQQVTQMRDPKIVLGGWQPPQ